MVRASNPFTRILRNPRLFEATAVLLCVILTPVASAQEVSPVVTNLQTQEQIELTRTYWNANVDIADRPVACDHFVFNTESAVYEMLAANWPYNFYLANDAEGFIHDPLLRDTELSDAYGNTVRSNVHHAHLAQKRGRQEGGSWSVANGIYSGILAMNSKEHHEPVSYDTATTEITTGSPNNAIRVWHSGDTVNDPDYSVCYSLDDRPFIPTGSPELGNSDLPAFDELSEFTFQLPQPVDAGTTAPVVYRIGTGEQVQFARGEWAYNEQIALTSMVCHSYSWDEGYQNYVSVPEFGYYLGDKRSFITYFSPYFDNGWVSTRTSWGTDLYGDYSDLERVPSENFELFSGEWYMELTDYGFNVWRPQLSTGHYERCRFPSPVRTLPLQPDNCDYSSADQFEGYGWNPVTRESCPPLDTPVVDQPSACIDNDGDGWGVTESLGESCLIDPYPLTQSTCDYSNADVYGGWGWNAATNQSCAPIENVADTQPITQCIDTDGDGYGWDGVATCSVSAGNPVAMTGTDGNCDYSDADLYGGWGWNAVASQSCAPLENVSDTQPTVQCIDTDGDGYGWDGTVSCIP